MTRKPIVPGTPEEYAAAVAQLLREGADPDALNQANHAALAAGKITLDHFQRAARILAQRILER